MLRILIKRMKVMLVLFLLLNFLSEYTSQQVGLATDLRNRQANKDIDEAASTSGQDSPITDISEFIFNWLPQSFYYFLISWN